MTVETQETLLDAVVELAARSGAVILEYYESGTEARRKADRTPVTDADEAAEALILPELEALSPGTVVVAEEAVAQTGVPEIADGRFWLVDPLDGTREFLKGNGEFTVNIALVEDGVPVLGVVHAPALALALAWSWRIRNANARDRARRK